MPGGAALRRSGASSVLTVVDRTLAEFERCYNELLLTYCQSSSREDMVDYLTVSKEVVKKHDVDCRVHGERILTMCRYANLLPTDTGIVVTEAQKRDNFVEIVPGGLGDGIQPCSQGCRQDDSGDYRLHGLTKRITPMRRKRNAGGSRNDAGHFRGGRAGAAGGETVSSRTKAADATNKVTVSDPIHLIMRRPDFVAAAGLALVEDLTPTSGAPIFRGALVAVVPIFLVAVVPPFIAVDIVVPMADVHLIAGVARTLPTEEVILLLLHTPQVKLITTIASRRKHQQRLGRRRWNHIGSSSPKFTITTNTTSIVATSGIILPSGAIGTIRTRCIMNTMMKTMRMTIMAKTTSNQKLMIQDAGDSNEPNRRLTILTHLVMHILQLAL